MPVQRIEKFQPLQAGQYWRAIQDFPQHAMFAGEVYLIEKLAFIDDALHTVYVRNHPKRYGHRVKVKGQTVEAETHEFLVIEFTAAFEFEPDAEKIRAAEVGDVHARLQGLQTETAQATPDTILLEAGFTPHNSLPLLGDLSSLANVTEESLALARTTAENEKSKATAIAKFYQSQADKIRNTVAELAPYFSEKAAGALASVSETTEQVAKMLLGLATLDLYLLKGVEIETIVTGDSAPIDLPLAIYQRKLFMDEEYCVWADVDNDFDYQDAKTFMEALASNASLQTQIFGATERAMVCMATRRRSKDYGNAWENYQRNEINREVFLLIRDGGNLYRVFSPVESHLSSDMLFPSFDKMGRHFTGIDGSEIKLEDVRYVKARKDHDDEALHFKRFLILMAGLDAQEQLFGQFYTDNREFISIEFQRRHLWFITDVTGEKMLPAENRPKVMDWIREKNSFLRSGSRVFGMWSKQISHATAPSCVSVDRQGNEYVTYRPVKRQSLQIAYASGHQRFVDLPVAGENRKWEQRAFNAKVLLQHTGEAAYLCLDDVTPTELDFYIHNRDARTHHLEYIQLFKRSLSYLQAEAERARPTYTKLLTALQAQGEFGRFETVEDLLATAVRSWRAIQRGRELIGLTTEEENELLTHCYWLARPAEFWAEKIGGAGLLRVALTGNNKILAYRVPGQIDQRLFAQRQVDCFEVRIKAKGKVSQTSKGMRYVFQQTLTETTLLETAECEHWATFVPDPLTYTEKQELMAYVGAGHDLFAEWGLAEDEAHAHFKQLRSLASQLSKKWVENPSFFIPLAAYCSQGKIMVAGIEKVGAAALIEFTSDIELRANIHHWFVGRYRNRDNGESKLTSDSWDLVALRYTAIDKFPFHHRVMREGGELLGRPMLKNNQWRHWDNEYDEVSWNQWLTSAAAAIVEKTEYEFAWSAPIPLLDLDVRFGVIPSKGRFDSEKIKLVQRINKSASLWANAEGDTYLCFQETSENGTQQYFRRILDQSIEAAKADPRAAFFTAIGKVFDIVTKEDGRTIETRSAFLDDSVKSLVERATVAPND